jgi:DNA-binding response OmpR family regulator
MRILLVEDDAMLGKIVKEAIEHENHVVDLASDGEMCEVAMATTKFDLVLLDVNLPDKSGIDILKDIRRRKDNIPVLILTARDGICNKIDGLNSGADDYLVKPFDLDELLARINALYRRSKGGASSLLTHEEFQLDSIGHKFTKNDVEIDLSPKEFVIMKCLMENVGKVISKEILENILYSWDNSVESNTVEVHIHHLRKKLDKSIIKTIRGVGYLVEKSRAVLIDV